MSKFKLKLKISYNAPVILTFCIFCVLIFVCDKYFFSKLNIIQNVFTVPGSKNISVNNSVSSMFNFKSAFDYLKLFTHVLGHASWSHLVGNLSFILLIGPLLEERYGSKMLLIMICVTALVTGVLNACLLPNPLLGASGIAFMLIILSSFTSFSKNEIPLSFIFVFVLFLGSELFLRKSDSNISVVAHIAGGLCGSMFGFLIAPKNARAAKIQPVKKESFNERMESFSKSKNDSKENSSADETVVGTIKF